MYVTALNFNRITQWKNVFSKVFYIKGRSQKIRSECMPYAIMKLVNVKTFIICIRFDYYANIVSRTMSLDILCTERRTG